MRCLAVLEDPEKKYPCGKCFTCRLRKKGAKTGQLNIHNQTDGIESVFVTLTLTDENMEFTTETPEPVLVVDPRELDRAEILKRKGWQPDAKPFVTLPHSDQVRHEEAIFRNHLKNARNEQIKFNRSEFGLERPLLPYEESWCEDRADKKTRQHIIDIRTGGNLVFFNQPGAPTINRNLIKILNSRIVDEYADLGVGFSHYSIGEYGGQTERPHYHAMWYPDFRGGSTYWSTGKNLEVGTKIARNTWRTDRRKADSGMLGMLTVSAGTSERAHYSCGYTARKMSKLDGTIGLYSLDAIRIDGSAPEFHSQSPRLGWDEVERLAKTELIDDYFILEGMNKAEFSSVVGIIKDQAMGTNKVTSLTRAMRENPRLTQRQVQAVCRVKEFTYGKFAVECQTTHGRKVRKYRMPYRLRQVAFDTLGMAQEAKDGLVLLQEKEAAGRDAGKTDEELRLEYESEKLLIAEADQQFQVQERERGSLFT